MWGGGTIIGCVKLRLIRGQDTLSIVVLEILMGGSIVGSTCIEVSR